MEDLISVIIPVYNVQKYLKRCVNSVCSQTYRNLEIILIDDGSKDKSSLICDRFAKKDKRVRVIHQKNAGVDKARNAGILSAGGGYITFVDSDDWLPEKALEILHNQICKTKAQICCGNYKTVLVSGAHPNRFYTQLSFEIQDKQMLASKFMRVVFPPWGKLYSAQVIKENALLFPVSMSINDDTYFVTDFITKCNRLSTVSDCVYYYNHMNIGSITGKYHKELNQCYVLGVSRRLEFYDLNDLPDDEQLTIVELFIVALKHYIVHLSSDVAIGKIQETHDLFREYLTLVSSGILAKHADNSFAKIYLENEDLLEGKRYKELLENLKKDIHEVSAVKRRMRNLILPILQFFVFKLQLGYKK